MEQSKDPTSESRKKDHITLAFQSQTEGQLRDNRFYYEPVLSGHPQDNDHLKKNFLGKEMKAPIWVSSMTGGTALASTINKNLARLCKECGLGMGLGSCRSLLHSDEYFQDFNMRTLIGDQPLYANLGIAQVEILIQQKQWHLVTGMIEKLQADGLIIHINPLQEWLQPEGDRYHQAPIDTIKKVVDIDPDLAIIVKEVGHGMGPKSIEALMQLPLKAIEFAAFGGTNFSKIELYRDQPDKQSWFHSLAHVGHTAEDMVTFVNAAYLQLGEKTKCKEVIISGGIKDFLDGYYLINQCQLNAVYGQASTFLKYAMQDYDTLMAFAQHQIDALSLAYQMLTIKK